MATDLPNEFDVIVLGTGLTESILAAAFSRIGLKVLHIDRNDYYSASWASFNLQAIEKWRSEQQKATCFTSQLDEEKLSALLKTGEKVIELPKTFCTIDGTVSSFHVEERPKDDQSGTIKSSSTHVDTAEDIATTKNTEEAGCGNQPSEAVLEAAASGVEEESGQNEAKPDRVSGQFDSASEDEAGAEAQKQDGGDGKEVETIAVGTGEESSQAKKEHQWFADDIQKEWRRFSLDLAPRLVYCAGSMVELLIASDVAKYCEFRTVSRVLTIRDNKLEKVPCSRADVFGSKVISLPEKRLLMKFLTFAAEYEQHTDEYKDYADRPFVEFLTSRKLSPKIQHFVLHSIAMATHATPTEQGLASTQKFLRSLGRYGNTAFLFPLYGSGEIPQAFCRLSAVFGGCYVLTLSASHIILNEENRCAAVVTSAGQRITCKYLIADPSYVPETFYKTSFERKTSRGVFVTDRTTFPSEEEELSLLRIPQEGDCSDPTTVLELPPSAMVSPRNLYVVHMIRPAQQDACSDLQQAVNALFHRGADSAADEEFPRPRVLWSLYFQQRDMSVISPADSLPPNVFVTTGPGSELDMDRCVAEAQNIFKQVCPEEEFLPKPPHPDDIIYVDDEETSAAGAGSDDWTHKSDSEATGDSDSKATGDSETKVTDDGERDISGDTEAGTSADSGSAADGKQSAEDNTSSQAVDCAGEKV